MMVAKNRRYEAKGVVSWAKMRRGAEGTVNGRGNGSCTGAGRGSVSAYRGTAANARLSRV
jgi:hypothetical protein